ncbi:MAG: hypothetical protein AAGJ35_03590 [Myxococcota bacterium]
MKEQYVKDFFETNLTAEADANLNAEWSHLQLHGIERLWLDARSALDIVRYAVAKCLGKHWTEVKDIETAAAELHLVNYAMSKRPKATLFHFDEVGSDADHNIDNLRKLAVRVWHLLWEIKAREGAEAMPRIYFLVTGRSTAPFELVGTGRHGSPCGSRFLLLDMLNPAHVSEVRRCLSDAGNLRPESKSVALSFPTLDEGKHGHYLDQCLQQATGGAPRLLLYTLRALQWLLHHTSPCVQLTSEELIHDAIFHKVYEILWKIKVVAREFSPHNHVNFAYLFALSLQDQPLEGTMSVTVKRKPTPLWHLLRFEPFFLSRLHRNGQAVPPGSFTLCLPRFHQQAAQDRLTGVPTLLVSAAGAHLNINEPWRVFEYFPAQVVALRASLRKVMGVTPASWAEAVPELFAKSQLARQAKFHLGSHPYAVHHEQKELPKAIEGAPKLYVDKGAIFGRDKSNSGDMFHVQQKLTGTGYIVIEWQQKFLVNTKLTMTTARDELKKSVQSLPTIHVLFSSQVGQQLQSAMEHVHGKVLVLRAWDATHAAEYTFGKGKKVCIPTKVVHCVLVFCRRRAG